MGSRATQTGQARDRAGSGRSDISIAVLYSGSKEFDEETMSRSHHVTMKKLAQDLMADNLDEESVKSCSDKRDLKKEMRWCRKNGIPARNAVVDGLIKRLKRAGFTESGEY